MCELIKVTENSMLFFKPKKSAPLRARIFTIYLVPWRLQACSDGGDGPRRT